MNNEKHVYFDALTGVKVTRLTSYRANSNHLYFTNNCFYDGGRRMIFASERGNAHNLFSMELESGEIEQITDFPVPKNLARYDLNMSYVDGVNARCVCFMGKELLCIDLKTLSVSTIYRVPDGFLNHIVSVSADGKYAYTSIYEDSPEKRKGNALTDFYLSRPLSKIEQISLDGSGSKTVFSDYNFIAHVNTSPTDSSVLTFCHEGKWHIVDHRLWALDLTTGKASKLHPCQKGECIGHEYWFASGTRVGYHGYKDGKSMLGAVNSDGTSDICCEFPYPTMHIFSSDERLIVGDGSAQSPYLRLWSKNEISYDEARVLCRHGSSFKNQDAHTHPRYTPDGKSLIYTSDESGNNQIYSVEIPENISTLPFLSDSVK